MSESTKRRRLKDVSIGEISMVKKGAVPGSDFVVLTKEDTSVDQISQAIELLKSIESLTVEAAGPIVELIKERVGIEIYHSEWDEDSEPEVAVRLNTTMDKLSERMSDLESAVQTVASAMKVEKEDLAKEIDSIKALVKRDESAIEPTDGNDETVNTEVAKEDEIEETATVDPLTRAVQLMRKSKLQKANSATRVTDTLALAIFSMSSLTKRLDEIKCSMARACGQDT